MRYAGYALVVALVLTAGCIGGDFDTMDPEEADVLGEVPAEEVETDETGDEILGTAVESLDEAETASFEAENRMAFDASLFSMTVSMESDGEVETGDIGHVSTDGGMRGEILGTFDNRTEFETETYVTPTTTYKRHAEDGDELGDWTTTETGLDDGGLTIGTEGIASVIEDADATVEGADTVDGDEVYVLSLDPETEELTRHTVEIFDAHAVDDADEFEEDEDDEEVGEDDMTELEAYLWVDRDTREPVRLSYYLLATGVEEGDEEDDSDGFAGMEMYFDGKYSYGEPVDAEPPEAD